MVSFTYRIQGAAGLHARPATVLSRIAAGGEAHVRVACGASACDACDLMGLFALDAACGDVLMFTVQGPDERSIADALEAACTF